jgi:hypothetical protein
MHLPTHFPARLTGAAAVACAAALTPVAALAATGNPAAPAPAASTPRCVTPGLVIWLDVPPGNHYAGGAAYYLEFTNLSGHACTLRGYPGVSAVSLTGRQLGRLGHPRDNHGQARQRGNRHRGPADRRSGSIRQPVPSAPAMEAAMAARDAAHRGRAARIPAKPVRVESDPVPIPRMRAHRAGLHPRRAGNSCRSSRLIPRSAAPWPASSARELCCMNMHAWLVPGMLAMPHMACAGPGRIRSAGPETFARAIDGHLGPATTSTPGRRTTRAESLDGITLRDRTIRENARRAAAMGGSVVAQHGRRRHADQADLRPD